MLSGVRAMTLPARTISMLYDPDSDNLARSYEIVALKLFMMVTFGSNVGELKVAKFTNRISVRWRLTGGCLAKRTVTESGS